MSAGGVRASVLVPTHDHASTLDLTVRSVLAQEMADLEVVVIGDGVGDDTREVMAALVAGDARVRFLDLPKGEHHGEHHRHTAVAEARSDALLYLCDDDLFMPGHVGDLLALLEDADLVHCRNGYVDDAGRVRLYAGDLADPAHVERLLAPKPRYNSVSITGTGHTRAVYDRLVATGDGWEPNPKGEWTDHFMWKKLLRLPGVRGATSRRMTALQFPTSTDGRDAWSAARRREELEPWLAFTGDPGAQDRLDDLVDAAQQAELAELRVQVQLQAARLEEVDAAAQRYLRRVESLAARVEELEGRPGLVERVRRRTRG